MLFNIYQHYSLHWIWAEELWAQFAFIENNGVFIA